ncbi:MAG: hypothetical protein U1F36_00590 [Planctomycetota bacterium]
MHKLSCAALLALSALGFAQSPLTTLSGGTNLGNVGGGIYFDLHVNTTITITQIDFLCSANTVAGTGTLNVFLGPTTYIGNVTNPNLWAVVGTATTAVAPSTVANGVLTQPFALGPGDYGIALQSNAFSHGYTNGVTCTSNTIPGSCSNSLFSNAELTLRAGAAQNVFLSGGIFNPRIFNGAIHYTLGGTPVQVAAWEPYGKGCYARYRSFYQLFPNPVGFNMGNTGGVTNPVSALRLQFANSAYHVVPSTNTIVPPISAPVTLSTNDSTFNATSVLPGAVLPFPIPHPLNGGVTFAFDLGISTDGYIVPAPASMANNATVAVATFLSQAPRWCPHWKNMAPLTAGSGIYVEQDTSGGPGGPLLVTWNNVADNALTTTSSFQVAFYSNGDVEYRYGVMSQNGGGSLPVIVGWTEGGGALDPGSIEISTSLPIDTFTVDNQPLTLGLNNRPLLGGSANTTTSAVPGGTSLGAIAFGFTQLTPGLDLSGIGMAGCRMLTSFDVTASVPVTGSSFNFSLPIPNITALNGGLIYAQSLSVSGGYNTLGVLTSNGVRMKLGSL